MASNLEQILGRNIDSVKSLKTAIKELQDSMVGLDTDSQEYKDTASKLSAAQNALNATTKAGIEANLAAKDSIVGMQKEYNNLYDAYKKLSDEQRNSDIGKSMAKSLSNLSETINNSKKEVGNFTSNIGQYAQGATEAFNNMGISLGALQTPMKLASGGAKTLGASLKALIANPVGATIMAIVVAFKAFQAIAERVKQAIQDNEETQNRLTEAMSVFRPVLDGISNAFDFLAKLTVKVIEGFSKVAEKVMSIIPGMKKAIDSHKDLAKATNDLTKAERENSIILSQKQSEVETLRAEAAAATDATEKQQLLEEAKAKQMEIDQEYVNMAQEELRIMEEYAAKTANDAEANDKLAAAQKKVNDAIATGQKHQKEFNEQLKATTNEIKSQTSAENDKWEDEKEELKKFNDEYEDSLKTREELTNEHYDRLLELAKKHNEDTTNIEKSRQKELNKIRLEGLSQSRQDFNESVQLDLQSGNKVSAIEKQIDDLTDEEKGALVKIEAINKMVNARYHSLSDQSKYDRTSMETLDNTMDYAQEKAKEWVDFINKNHFEALGDEDQELKDAVAELNAEFGLSITTLTNLETASDTVKLKIKKLRGELQEALVDEETSKDAEAQLEGLIKTVTYDTYEGYQAYVKEQNRKALETEKTAIEEQLANFQGTEQQKLEMMQRYYEIVAEMRQQDYEDEKAKQEALEEFRQLRKARLDEMFESLIDMTDKMASSLSSYKSTRESVIDSEVKAGKISEEEGKRRKDRLLKLEKLERDFAIATIAADAASGIFKIWKGWATETGEINPASSHGNAVVLAGLNAASTLSAVAKSASLAATATAQIAAAKGKYIVAENNMIGENGGAGGGVGATPALINSTPYEYTRTIQTTEEEERLNAPIFVTVTDIEEGLAHRATVTDESSF